METLANNLLLNNLRCRLLLVICCIVCYGGTLQNEFSMDDDFSYYDNMYVQKGVSGIPDILTHPYYNDGTLSFDYRPVAGVTFAIEKEFFGNNPHVAHSVNLVLYIIAVLLVFSVLLEVFELGFVPALLIGLFFAIHPAHTEVVASIKNREEIFSLIFALLALIFSHRLFTQKTQQGRMGYLMLALLFMGLSLISKLSNLSMVPIIIISLYFRGRHRNKTSFYPLAALLTILTVLYVGKIAAMNQRPIYDLENPLVSYHDLSSKMGTSAATLFFYLRFMFVPYPFSYFYGYNTIPVIGAGAPLSILSIFIHLVIFVYGAYLFFRKDKIGLFIIAYLIAISAYNNLAIIYTGIVSERALFAPSLYFIAAVVCIVYKWQSGLSQAMRRVFIAIGVVWFCIYGVLTINRSQQWHDTIKLMSSDIEHLQNSTLANYFYACVLKIKGEEQPDPAIQDKYLSEAKKYFNSTSTLSPSYPYAYFRMGLIYRYDRYTPDSAYYFFRKAYTLNPALPDVDYQYGRAEYEFGDMKLSNDIFADLYKKLPGDTFTVFYHALLLMKTGHPEEGHQINDIFMKMTGGQNYYQPYFNEGLYYQIVGDAANAALNYEKSLSLGCQDQTVYRYLIEYYRTQGRTNDVNRLLPMLR